MDELFLVEGRVYWSLDAGDFRATTTYEPYVAASTQDEQSLVSLLRRLSAPDYASTGQLDDEISLLKEWEALYEELMEVLERHGRHDPFGEGDYYLVADCYACAQHKVECASKEVFTPGLVSDVQSALRKYIREWEVIIALPPVGGKDHAFSVYAKACVEHTGS